MKPYLTLAGRSRQRGMLGVLAAIMLVVGVLLILNQTLGTLTTRSVDTTRQLDSTAALALAESGLQRAQAVFTDASITSTMTEALCTSTTGSGPYDLGVRGSFTYGAATALPSGCNATSNPCASCEVTAIGTVNSTRRSLKMKFDMGVVNGVAGRGTTVTMVLKNTYDRPAMALFNLAWRRQEGGGGGNVAGASTCTNGASGCTDRWNIQAQSGNQDVGSIGVSVDIAANTLSKPVTQTLAAVRNYAEVGALFPANDGALVAPTVTGSYWDDASNGSPNPATVGKSNTVTGQTNSGVATTSGTCAVPNVESGSHTDTKQTCNNWCSAADTVAIGVSGRSGDSSVTQQISSITFNTAGSPAQNVAFSRIVHFPDTSGVISSATDIYSEVWYAHNTAYTASHGATTYNAMVTGYAGTAITTTNSNKIKNGDLSMTIDSVSGAPICVGQAFADPVTASKIQSVPGGGTCSSAVGTYGFTTGWTGGNVGSAQIAGTTLFVVSSIGNLTLNASTNTSGVTATAFVSPNYTLQAPGAYLPLNSNITQGTGLSTTVTLPSGATLPAVGTRVAIYSGTGSIPANTTVTAVNSGSFQYTLSQAPTTGIQGALLCGGTCAFFNGPSSTSSVTTFQISKTSNTEYWTTGFMCMSGVKASLIVPVTSTFTKSTTWSESIQ